MTLLTASSPRTTRRSREAAANASPSSKAQSETVAQVPSDRVPSKNTMADKKAAKEAKKKKNHAGLKAIEPYLAPAFDLIIISLFSTTFYFMREDLGALKLIVIGFVVSAIVQYLIKYVDVFYDACCLNRDEVSAEAYAKSRMKHREMYVILAECFISIFFEWKIFVLYDFIWWTDNSTIWSKVPVISAVTTFYCVTIGRWIMAAISTRFFEARDPDWILLYFHHVVTITLITCSYLTGNCRVGVCILFLHQVSDIFISLCKATHYLSWDWDHTPLPVAEGLFVLNLVTWAYTRLYLYPKSCIWSAIVERSVNGVVNQRSWDFDVLIGGGIILEMMHWFWFIEMIRVAVKLLLGESATKAGSSYLEEETREGKRKKSN